MASNSDGQGRPSCLVMVRSVTAQDCARPPKWVLGCGLKLVTISLQPLKGWGSRGPSQQPVCSSLPLEHRTEEWGPVTSRVPLPLYSLLFWLLGCSLLCQQSVTLDPLCKTFTECPKQAGHAGFPNQMRWPLLNTRCVTQELRLLRTILSYHVLCSQGRH